MPGLADVQSVIKTDPIASRLSAHPQPQLVAVPFAGPFQ